jgi:GH25 family lysozyme M1 (1,4-beta-N-acetylmuramidase)
VSFGFGPEWARDTGCCAKPIGCTYTGPACLMRGHPWKRRHALTPDQPVPFRAGRTGETPPLAAATAHLAAPSVASVASGQVVLLADVSEWQPDIADATYLRWSKAIVVRALYGTRVDKAWYGGARRDALHAGGARFVGIYAYITSQDITAQAKALIPLLGKLRPGEKVIADIEEGPGSQQARWVTWAKAVNAALHDPPWDYSGLNYAAAHGLQPVTWVAAYGTREPDPPHTLWQFTDAFKVPGVGTADCSVFHGGIDDLAALAYQGAKPAPHPAARFHGEYETAGMYSLAGVAAKLGTTPSALLRMTAVRYRAFGDSLAAYLNDPDTKLASTPLPKGIRFWVD